MSIEKKGRIVIWVSLALVFVCPFIFSQPAFWDGFNFSKNGQIGDAIGGITAPIIGLASVLLLFWTLLEQVRINKDQELFNEISRILATLSHIQRLDDGIVFLYSTPYSLCEGKGLSSLASLESGKVTGAFIAFEELLIVERKVGILLSSVQTLSSIVESGKMNPQDKDAYQNIVDDYKRKLFSFYDSIANGRVYYVFPLEDAEKWEEEENAFVERALKISRELSNHNNKCNVNRG